MLFEHKGVNQKILNFNENIVDDIVDVTKI